MARASNEIVFSRLEFFHTKKFPLSYRLFTHNCTSVFQEKQTKDVTSTNSLCGGSRAAATFREGNRAAIRFYKEGGCDQEYQCSSLPIKSKLVVTIKISWMIDIEDLMMVTALLTSPIIQRLIHPPPCRHNYLIGTVLPLVKLIRWVTALHLLLLRKLLKIVGVSNVESFIKIFRQVTSPIQKSFHLIKNIITCFFYRCLYLEPKNLLILFT